MASEFRHESRTLLKDTENMQHVMYCLLLKIYRFGISKKKRSGNIRNILFACINRCQQKKKHIVDELACVYINSLQVSAQHAQRQNSCFGQEHTQHNHKFLSISSSTRPLVDTKRCRRRACASASLHAQTLWYTAGAQTQKERATKNTHANEIDKRK